MFYLLDKKKGVSSHKFIKNFAKEHDILKIGHSGTLDPLASGALLVATNSDTKLIEFVSNKNKTYVVEFKLGYSSSTYDAEGEVKKVGNDIFSLANIKLITSKFVKKIKQIPPSFSAKKVNGIRSYKLARAGKEVKLKSIEVEIFDISNIKKIEKNLFSFIVSVSNGTYVRTLVHDIGLKLNSDAIMTNLRRTKIGDLEVLKDVQIINPLQIIKMEQIILNKITDLIHGKEIKVTKNDGQYLLIFKAKIIGVGNVKKNILKSQKIFGERIKKIL